MYRKIRIALACVAAFCLTLYCLDFSGLIPHLFYRFSQWQFLPAVLGHSDTFLNSIIIVGTLLAITFLFGRIYCSILCPMGIFQDIIIWLHNRKFIKKFSNRLRKLTAGTAKKPVKKIGYRKPKTWLRWATLSLFIIGVIFGWAGIVSLVEPYSAYSRIAVHIFRPVYLYFNNVLTSIFTSFGIYSFYKMEIYASNILALTVSIATFVIISFLAWRYGRSFCSSICPTGTILGTVNRVSLFNMRINESKCTHCGACGLKCKAHCINSKEQNIDYSRCVNCFDCIDYCSVKAIEYKVRYEKKDVKTTDAKETDNSRRKFIATIAVLPLLLGKKAFALKTGAATYTANGAADGMTDGERTIPIAPPGALSHEHLKRHCTSCHLCVSKCPSRVIKPAMLEYGLGGIMQPVMDFEKGFCNYDCTICTEICPNDALKPLTKEQKHLTQIGKVVFILERCVVYKNEASCGACSEHCPTQAVKMVNYKNGLTIPQIDTSICVGCGGCEHICPVRPYRAIYVEGSKVHEQAVPIKLEERDDMKINDFGF
ncbi:MAG: 4Fe-4S dicluster domain-containing protein [Bacteroidales bacterium]|jgi:ferredoxin|nr:4Fe-4S dicluster domain-containing protein [Bacteroidales bacterium]